MFTILGLFAWNFTAPQQRRLIPDEPDPEQALARRGDTVEIARRLTD